MAKSHLITGAHVVLYVNGRMFAKVTGFRWSVQTPRKAFYGLDSTEPYELGVRTSRISGSISLLRGMEDGGAEGAGMTATLHELPRENYFSIALVDRRTDKILFQARRCSVLEQSWDAPVRGYVTGSVNFEAIDWDNEVGGSGHR